MLGGGKCQGERHPAAEEARKGWVGGVVGLSLPCTPQSGRVMYRQQHVGEEGGSRVDS